jgi:hypothetical protein
VSYGQTEKPCDNYRLWLSNPGLCANCAWPQQDHKEKIMQPHQQRVVEEKAQLDKKLVKLHAFCFGSDTTIFGSLSPEERDRLEDQYTAMKQYSDILGKRIAAF